MGNWGAPNTQEAVDRLRTMMAEPALARSIMDDMGDILGNDTLWDVLWEAIDNDPSMDARPLVASHLEFLANWYPIVEDEDLRRQLAEIAQPYADVDVPKIEDLLIADDRSGDAAIRQAIACTDKDQDRALDFSAKRIAPGAYAVVDGRTGEVHRVECRYGIVNGSEGRDRELRNMFFPRAEMDPNAPGMSL